MIVCKSLALSFIIHHLPHQVGQVELVNVHGKVDYVFKAKAMLFDLWV